ncbi:MAG: acyltransferase family protein [Christensenellales bacterium]|jgi:acyltransferase
MKKAERIGWIDTLRAFAVFAIVLGHTLRNATVVYPWLYSFHVPLCVLTSGIVFHVGQKEFRNFLKVKIQTLMIPYYSFATVSIVIYALLGSKMEKTVGGGYDVSPLQSVIGMLYANSGTGLMRWNMPLWYIPMIFVLLLMAYWVFNKRDDLKWNILVLVISSGAAIFFNEVVELPNLPFGLETAIYMFPLFTLGKVIGSIQGKLASANPMSKVAIATICIAAGTFMTIGNGQVSYNADSYGKHGFVYFLVMAMLLCIGFVIIATCIPNGVKSINYVGKNTVGIMVMHKFPILFFVGLFPLSKRLIGTYPLAVSIVVATLSVVMCLVASEIIYRVCPIVLGRRKM